MSLAKLAKKPVVAVTADTAVVDAAKQMREAHVGDVVVVERKGSVDRPVGILTDRDITVAVVALGIPIEGLRVSDVMSTDLTVAKVNDSVFHVMDIMKDKGIRRLPIVGPQGELAGILTVDDLMGLLSKELAALAGIQERQRTNETAHRRKFA